MLLFSTFTSRLALIRVALEADGVSLLYLDGSMSPKQRVVEVDAFQAGDGDVFLLSTKAGGVGLNLTAATVVAHVDPWWNPASEDQATDRAHRPVTVVRFVSAGTIEEQIVAQHATKRALADALLSESGSSRHVGLDELVELMSPRRCRSLSLRPHRTPRRLHALPGAMSNCWPHRVPSSTRRGHRGRSGPTTRCAPSTGP